MELPSFAMEGGRKGKHETRCNLMLVLLQDRFNFTQLLWEPEKNHNILKPSDAKWLLRDVKLLSYSQIHLYPVSIFLWEFYLSWSHYF